MSLLPIFGGSRARVIVTIRSCGDESRKFEKNVEHVSERGGSTAVQSTMTHTLYLSRFAP
jgi:hypothetical protein